MLNQDSKIKLIDVIEASLNDTFINKNYRKIAPNLKDRIRIGKIADLFNKNLQVNMIKLSEMYFLAKELKNFIINNKEKVKVNAEDIEVSNFFTTIEIRQFETEPVLSDELKDENTYVFENVYKTTEKQFIIPVTQIKELVDLFYNNFVKYDFRMQREAEKRNYKGVIKYERAKTYNKSVKDIANAMLNRTYIPTAVSFNILKTGEENFHYNEDNHTLTVIKDEFTEMSIIDGYHRIMACMEALTIDPSLNQVMQLNIFNFDIAEARTFIYQEGQKNAINPLLLKHYNQTNIYNTLSNEIVNQGNRNTNKLYEMIGTTMEDVKVMDKLTTFEIFTSALEQHFEFDKDDMIARRKIKNYIVEFFNELFSIYKDELKNTKVSRLTSYILNPNIFYGYIYLASEIQFVENWQDRLEEIVRQIDFNKNGKLTGFGLENDKITKKNIKEINKYLKELI